MIKMSFEENKQLTSIPTLEEIMDVIFQIGDLKSTGPGGFSRSVFQLPPYVLLTKFIQIGRLNVIFVKIQVKISKIKDFIVMK